MNNNGLLPSWRHFLKIQNAQERHHGEKKSQQAVAEFHIRNLAVSIHSQEARRVNRLIFRPTIPLLDPLFHSHLL